MMFRRADHPERYPSRIGVGVTLLALLIVTMLAISSVAAHAAAPPGGTVPLSEVHDDWIVQCVAAPQGQGQGQGQQQPQAAPQGGKAAAQPAGRICTMLQQLTVTQGGQRVLAIELRPSPAGTSGGAANASADGVMMLPFGLALSRGVSLQIDTVSLPPVSIRTCLPAGCVAPLHFDAQAFAALRRAAALKVRVSPDDGGADAQWAISLKGFGPAFDRLAVLQR
jgi:invasion protein IalB